jgi:trehalose/maltose transport system substrate-binding protein
MKNRSEPIRGLRKQMWSLSVSHLRRIRTVFLSAMLLAACGSTHEPVTLSYPHGWSFRPDELATRLALSEQFTRETGIRVRHIPTPESTFDQLDLYRKLLQRGSSGADLFGLDLIWSGILERDLIDMRPYFAADLPSIAPQLLPSYTVDGKVVAIPYQVNIGSLEYRADLLREYGYDHPPKTWDELESMAKRIQAGERAKGKKDFWGFVWQGAEAEALTCNALEWQVAEGGGRIVESDRTVSVNNPAAIRAWQRARRWIGWISPPSVVAYRERDSMNVFDSGRAAFDRIWLGTTPARSGPSSQIYWRNLEPVVKTGFTRLPGGPGGSAGTLGGAGLAVSRYSDHPREAVKLVQFLVHQQIQSIEKRRDASGNRPEFYNPAPVPAAGSDSEKGIQSASGAVNRPSIETGGQYHQVSLAYVRAVRSVLTGEKGAPEAAAELENQLIQITGFRPGPPKK